jgi:hypothetical protein
MLATSDKHPVSVPDPLLYEMALPRVETCFPLGYALELSTNSDEIAMAAARLWARYPAVSDEPPVRLRIAVSPEDAAHPPVPSIPRGFEHLVMMTHGTGNLAVCDLAQALSFACLTHDVAANIPYVTHYFLEPLAYLMLGARHFTMVHAACVAWNNRAVLLCGDSGSGKTCLAYACARRGWTFVSGEATQIVRSALDHRVVGRPFTIRFRETARRFFPELNACRVAPGPNGKMDIEVDTADLPLVVAPNARASHVIFLDRSPDAGAAALNPVAFDDAFGYLEQTILAGHEQLRREQRKALAQFLTLPALRLTYSDIDSAERLLRALVAGGEA